MRRAIILVPGFAKREQLSARSDLVDAIMNYADGWKFSLATNKDKQIESAVQINGANRMVGDAVTLDVFEAYWGDLIPDWSNESPWQRFLRASSLIYYWALGGLLKALWRLELPRRTTIAMFVAAATLIFWYLTVIAVLLNALADNDELPSNLKVIIEAIPYVGTEISSWIKTLLQETAALPIVLFLIATASLGFVEKVSNVASFAKSYLQDASLGEDKIGVRAKAKMRLIEKLDYINGLQDSGHPTYDEIYVVAHSMGGTIAIDALAEFGNDSAKITLVTWGSALGLLVQQEAEIEREIAKLYFSDVTLKNWIDVVFTTDYMASKAPLPQTVKLQRSMDVSSTPIFPTTIDLTVPAGFGHFSERTHNGYYKNQDALSILVKPASELPQTENRRSKTIDTEE